jgi:hypothetical protein
LLSSFVPSIDRRSSSSLNPALSLSLQPP